MADAAQDEGAAALVAGADGRVDVRGALTFDSVGRLQEEGERLIAGGAREFDLRQVTRADSAGLALLVGWLAVARERGVTLRYVELPDRLRAIARISEVDALLGGTASA